MDVRQSQKSKVLLEERHPEPAGSGKKDLAKSRSCGTKRNILITAFGLDSSEALQNDGARNTKYKIPNTF